MKLKLIGTQVNWNKFEELRKQRWHTPGKQSGEIVHCKEHDTYFLERDEPCWECYDSCEEKL